MEQTRGALEGEMKRTCRWILAVVVPFLMMAPSLARGAGWDSAGAGALAASRRRARPRQHGGPGAAAPDDRQGDGGRPGRVVAYLGRLLQDEAPDLPRSGGEHGLSRLRDREPLGQRGEGGPVCPDVRRLSGGGPRSPHLRLAERRGTRSPPVDVRVEPGSSRRPGPLLRLRHPVASPRRPGPDRLPRADRHSGRSTPGSRASGSAMG